MVGARRLPGVGYRVTVLPAALALLLALAPLAVARAAQLDAVFANIGPNLFCPDDGAGGFLACQNVSGDAESSAGVALRCTR